MAAVILTMGERPRELACAIGSILRQAGQGCRVVLVVNGPAESFERPAGVDVLLQLPENVGIPAARHHAMQTVGTDLVLFLDDDAELLDDQILSGVRERFDDDPRLGVIALRLVDETGATARRHVPRIGAASASESGPVTAFLGGACVVRAAAYSSVGGYDPKFFYAMEETDLSWRLLDHGWSIWYAADWAVFHPATTPSRHHQSMWFTARNRFWASWRSLPWPILLVHLSTWLVISLVRRDSLSSVLAGYREGWRTRPSRAPVRWRTVARMTRLGRPPII